MPDIKGSFTGNSNNSWPNYMQTWWGYTVIFFGAAKQESCCKNNDALHLDTIRD